MRPITFDPRTAAAKAVPSFAHDARLNADFLRDRTRAQSVSRQQHYPRPVRIPLRAARCSNPGKDWPRPLRREALTLGIGLATTVSALGCGQPHLRRPGFSGDIKLMTRILK